LLGVLLLAGNRTADSNDEDEVDSSEDESAGEYMFYL
jgi:hypothetical protein